MKSILELNHNEAREFLLKASSYITIDLPQYFNFQTLLNKISNELNGKNVKEVYRNYDRRTRIAGKPHPCDFDKVNYRLLTNKDGKYSWRPLEIIHPVLYVALVHELTNEKNWRVITDRFKILHGNTKISCQSIPLKSEDRNISDKATIVSNWYEKVEQESIKQSLLFDYVLHTDITDCYSSIYTHSVPWAIHTKEEAKKPANRTDESLIGVYIDKILQNMSYGQTNGIPQGSTLMDFISEMVLGYADLKLTEEINKTTITDYKIIRYRDDYRIFTNNPQDAELIAKLLTEVLIDLGLKLNPNKTFISNDIIKSSIKDDKQYWNTAKHTAKSLQGTLLIIRHLSQEFSNSGTLSKALNSFHVRLEKKEDIIEDILVLINIVVDIALNNPRVYSNCAAILSLLLPLVEDDTIIDLILRKFEKIPNIGYLQLWLQRITLSKDRSKVYNESLCKKIYDPTICLWNCDWLNVRLKSLVNSESIIDEAVILGLTPIIKSDETALFKPLYDD